MKNLELQFSKNTLSFKILHPFKNHQAGEISISSDVAAVGLMFSGGVDSTLLLALLKLYSLSVRPLQITAFTVEHSDVYEHYAAKILSLEPFKDIRHITKIPNSRKDGVIREGITYVLRQPDIQLLYTGVNKIPDVEIAPNPPRRDSEAFISTIPKLRCPLLSFTKDYSTLALKAIGPEYYQTNLYAMTHSCTQSIVPCQKCWFCCERQWGEAQIKSI